MAGPRYALVLRCEVKGALVEPRVAKHFPGDAGAEKSFEHILLEAGDDRILLEQIHDRRVAFVNMRTAFSRRSELGHASLAIAHAGEPFRAFGHSFSFYLCPEGRGLFFKN